MGFLNCFSANTFCLFCSLHGLFTCIQPSMRKHDWSIVQGLQTETRKLPMPKPCPVDYRFFMQIMFIEIRVALTLQVVYIIS